MKKFETGKPNFFRSLLVKNGLWPADFSIMYTCYKYKMFKITLNYREVSGSESVLNQQAPEKVRFPGKNFHSVILDFYKVSRI